MIISILGILCLALTAIFGIRYALRKNIDDNKQYLNTKDIYNSRKFFEQNRNNFYW